MTRLHEFPILILLPINLCSQIELPPDIHHIPESVNAYVGLVVVHLPRLACLPKIFLPHITPPRDLSDRPIRVPQFVYSFTLDPYVVNAELNRRTTIAVLAAHREAHLRPREDEKQRRKPEVLRRIAPGFEPLSAPLVPVKTDAALG